MYKEKSTSVLIKELSALITTGNAHINFDDAVKDLPLDLLTIIPENLPYNLWQLTEHIRITQWDIVEFCINPNHKSPDWPDEYWDSSAHQPSLEQWNNSLYQIKADRERFLQLLQDPAVDLYKPLAHGTGQNILREALLIADHTAYHTGEIIVLRRLLKIWKS